jgi:hypothetical protein
VEDSGFSGGWYTRMEMEENRIRVDSQQGFWMRNEKETEREVRVPP